LQTVSFLQYSNFEVLKDLIEVTEGNLDLKEKCNMLIDIYKSDRSNYSNYSQPVSNNMSFENVTQLEMKEPESSQKKKREIHNQKFMEIGNNVKGNIGKKK